MFSVALDAMGGDYGPSETIEAALKVINDYGYTVYLVGVESQISNILADKHYDKSLIHVIKADDVIEDNDNFIVIYKRRGIPVQSGTKSFMNILLTLSKSNVSTTLGSK